MKPRERFEKVLRHEQPDQVPQLIRWGKEMGEKLSEIFGVSGNELNVRFGNDAMVCQLGINAFMEMAVGDLEEGETITSEWGVVYQRQSGFNNPIKHPLENREDFKNYSFPDADDPRRLLSVEKTVSQYKDDYFIICDISSTFFEASMAHLRGMQEFILDCYDDPTFVKNLLDGLRSYYTRVAIRAVEAGTDMIRIGDDIGTQTSMLMPPELWRELVKPNMKQMIEDLRKVNPELWILYHSCGDFRAIMPDLVEIGVNMISTLQEVGSMNHKEIKKTFGEQLAFKGGLDTQQLLPNGTLGEVRTGVKKVLSDLASGGGYIFMPAHMLYQDVPIENIWAMKNAFDDMKHYPFQYR